jgi:hypothetical protein
MPFVELRPIRWKRRPQTTPAPATCVSIDADRFVELLVSRRHLSRVDIPDSRLCGLIDHEDGTWYMSALQDLKSQLKPLR